MERKTQHQQDLVDLIYLEGNLLFVPEGLEDIDIVKVVWDRVKQIQTTMKK